MTDGIRPLSAAALSVVVGMALLACKKKRAPPPPVATAAPTGGPAAPASQSFTGNYTIQSGRNANGTQYKGSVTISKHGDYDTLAWTITSGDDYSGVGIEMGGLLGVGWGKAKPGVVVYKVNGGSLDGQWAMAGAPSLGTENLSGPSGVSGTYKIVSSSSPASGGPYHGTVTITPKGALRTVRWKLTSGESYSGVGILDGDVFVVGWGSGVGVAVYSKAESGLSGRAAEPAAEGIGNEVLARK